MSERVRVTYCKPRKLAACVNPIFRRARTCVGPSLRKARKLTACATLFLILIAAIQATAQTKKTGTGRRKQESEQLTKTRENLVTATKEYKASLEKLLPFEETNAKNAADLVEKRKGLLE